MKAPLVSVVIPAYNAERHICGALESVMAQEVAFPLEIILVDDGSRIPVAEVVADIPFLRVVRQSNQGPSAARNRGVAEALGRYVAFLDSDDLWTEGKLVRQVEVLEGHDDIGLVFGDVRLSRVGQLADRSFFQIAGLDGSFWGDPLYVREAYRKLFRCNYVPTSSSMVRREAFVRAGGFDEEVRLVEDLDLWWRMALLCEFAHCDGVFVTKAEYEGNLSSNRIGMNESYIRVLKRHAERFSEELEKRDITIKERLAREYQELGELYLEIGKADKARECFLMSVRYGRTLRSALFWFGSLPVVQPIFSWLR